MERKLTKKYHFSVEGETEKWYLDWLKDNINQCDRSRYKVVMDCKVEKDPYKRAKKWLLQAKQKFGIYLITKVMIVFTFNNFIILLII